MREIEVKAKLCNEKTFLNAAQKLGIEFGEAISQEDTTYETTLPYDDPAWNIFRLRIQDRTMILTMKYKASTRSRDNHEYETTIGDTEEIAKMLKRLGYHKGVHISKQRRIAHYKGLELCLDELEDLGTFVEVEKLADENADVDSIQTELWKLLLELGIDPTDRIHKGYDSLMHEHKQLNESKK